MWFGYCSPRPSTSVCTVSLFLLAGAVEKFYLWGFGLATVLVFVGLKMAWLNELGGGKSPTQWSLAVIVVAITAAIVLSLLFPRRGTAHG